MLEKGKEEGDPEGDLVYMELWWTLDEHHESHIPREAGGLL